MRKVCAGLAVLAAALGLLTSNALGRQTKAPPAPRVTGTVLFDGSQKSSWPVDQSCTSTRVQNVANPTGGSAPTLRFTTLNTDVAPCTPTNSPRSQLLSPTTIYQPGSSYWVSYYVYLPSSFPKVTSWVQLGEPIYGPPFDGSPSIAFDLASTGFQWIDGPYEGYQDLWDAPIVRGQWVRVTWNFSVSSSGFCDLYINDREVAAENPFQVLDGANGTGPWFAALNLYYAPGEFSSATVYYRAYKIATTQAAAES